MKELLYIFLFLIFSVKGFSQNLVPNPSFELYSQCPDNANQIDRAIGWSTYSETPDYYHSCSPSSNYSTPNNVWGYQIPATGEGYAGGYFFTNLPVNAREIIGTQLSSPTIIGQKYYVSFKVSLTLSSPFLNAACNNLGVLFSTISYNVTNPIPLNNFAHVYTSSIITDTANWTTISGSFIADSAYQYMAIGNFFDDLNTNYTPYDSSGYYTAFYYIDDICVSTDSLFCNPVGVEENYFSQKIKIYPNPFNDFTNIVFEDASINDISLSLYDVFGENVKEFHNHITSKKITLQKDNLSEGIYFLKIQIGNQLFIHKLLITN